MCSTLSNMYLEMLYIRYQYHYYELAILSLPVLYFPVTCYTDRLSIPWLSVWTTWRSVCVSFLFSCARHAPEFPKLVIVMPRLVGDNAWAFFSWYWWDKMTADKADHRYCVHLTSKYTRHTSLTAKWCLNTTDMTWLQSNSATRFMITNRTKLGLAFSSLLLPVVAGCNKYKITAVVTQIEVAIFPYWSEQLLHAFHITIMFLFCALSEHRSCLSLKS